MIYRKYNQKQDTPERTTYTKVKFEVVNYDNSICLSITPTTAERGFESTTIFSGTFLKIGYIKRKNENTAQAMDDFILPYLDRLYTAFKADEIKCAEHAEKNGLAYTFNLDTATDTRALLIEIRDAFKTRFADKIK